jgi:hypothetical protein
MTHAGWSWLGKASIGLIATVMVMLPVAAASGDAMVYKGRAVFEETRPARIPGPFLGSWAKSKAVCQNRAAKNLLVINATTIAMASANLEVRRIYLNPSQRPHYDHAIVEMRKTGRDIPALILHLEDNGQLTTRVRNRTGASRYVRCR